MAYLGELALNNDREWWWKNEAIYRHALVNWNTFVTKLVTVATEVDYTLPHLPYKDLGEIEILILCLSNGIELMLTNF